MRPLYNLIIMKKKEAMDNNLQPDLFNYNKSIVILLQKKKTFKIFNLLKLLTSKVFFEWPKMKKHQ